MIINGAVLGLATAALILFGHVVCSDPTAQYKNLLRTLDESVNLVAPGEVDPQYSNVSLSLHLINIVEVNTKQRFLDATFYMQQSYKDPRVSWDSLGPKKLLLPADKVWAPDFEVYNGLAPIEYLTARTALLYSSGEVMLVPAVRIKVPCQTSDNNNNVTCTLIIGSWSHDGSEVNPVVDGSEPYVKELVPNQSWNLADSSAELKLKTCELFESVYPSVVYSFTFQRRPKKCVEE
ncbi:neuronal acetylcholine receptor subunit alpha-6-like [Liolophura sinensis]|uniref:neuronal acetylcholine receptor subunit alpha-6-like n=1 Tax=Liolophura sinensis TaxID=3198878 RepID=UPI0031583C0B